MALAEVNLLTTLFTPGRIRHKDRQAVIIRGSGFTFSLFSWICLDIAPNWVNYRSSGLRSQPRNYTPLRDGLPQKHLAVTPGAG